MVVIILQYIHASNLHIVHLKLAYVSGQYYLDKAGGKGRMVLPALSFSWDPATVPEEAKATC